MNVVAIRLAGLKTVELERFEDARGFFIERYNQERFRQEGLPSNFCQDNHSRSAPGVLRGLHYQTDPPQGKLIGVVHGRIWDVVVDIRPQSPTYGEHFACELNDTEGRLLWIPPGLAHGFCVLGDEPADVVYKVDQPYTPASEGGILWSDDELGIKWPVAQPMVSPRDQRLPPFKQYRLRPPAW